MVRRLFVLLTLYKKWYIVCLIKKCNKRLSNKKCNKQQSLISQTFKNRWSISLSQTVWEFSIQQRLACASRQNFKSKFVIFWYFYWNFTPYRFIPFLIFQYLFHYIHWDKLKWKLLKNSKFLFIHLYASMFSRLAYNNFQIILIWII